jgi:hypothetical protein
VTPYGRAEQDIVNWITRGRFRKPKSKAAKRNLIA